MIKKKGFKVLMISLLIILSTTCFSFLFANAYKTFAITKTENEILAWDGSGTSSDPYLINNTSDMNSLAANVDDGNTYDGKHFKMTQDIDFGNGSFAGIGGGMGTVGGANYKYFAGVFDGNGFCIKNLKTTGQFTRFTTRTSNKKNFTTYYHYTGIFINLGENATVKNLKVENSTSGVSQIEGTTYVSRYYYFDSLVCNYNGGGKVESCYINGSTDGNVVNSLIFNGSTAKVEGTSIYGSSINGEKPDWSSISSSINSIGGSTGSAFYYAEPLNNGWPIPRVFIKSWFNLTIYTNYASTKHTKFIYPGDLEDCVYNKVNETKNNTLVLLGNIFTAEDQSGYYVSGWSINYGGSFPCHPTYTLEKYKIKFGMAKYIDGTDLTSEQCTHIPADMEVTYGDKFNVLQETEGNLGKFLWYEGGGNKDHYYISIVYDIYSWGQLGSSNITNGMTIPDLGDNGTEITINPIVKLVPMKLKFKTAEYSTLKENNSTKNSDLEYTLTYNELIDVSITNGEYKYEFKQEGQTSKTTITYTYDANIYGVTSATLETDINITNETEVTLTTEQHSIYVEFKNTTGDYSATPSRTDRFTIAYNEGNYTITNAMPENGVANKTLAYTLNGGEVSNVTYTIPAIYMLADAGINKTQTLVTITPVIEQKYVMLNFQTIEAGKTTNNIVIGANGTSAEYSALMDKTDALSATVSGTTLTFTFKKDGVNQTVAYDLSTIKRTYYLTSEKYTENPETGTPREVRINISLKKYDITFG